MKFLSKTAIAALLTGAIGLTAVPTAVFAQDQGAAPQGQMQMQGGKHNMQGNKRFGGQEGHGQRHARGGGILELVCSERGAEQLEIAFVRLSHRLELTAEQTPLFDDLKATALSAQTSFADTCTAARPAKDAAAKPDLLERMKTRVAIETAHVEAINTVLPKLEALFASLSDEQKAGLQPKGDRGQMGQKGPKGPMGQMGQPADAPVEDEAPTPAPEG
jgi:LTXXQ motif family protein